MRKSRYVTFLIAAATLSACDQNNSDGTDAMLYSDPSACSKEMDANTCNEAYAVAQTEHVQQAPKFATQAECEAAGFSQCQVTEVKTAEGTGGSFFMPMMMGYMMGNMMGGGRSSFNQPVYRGANNTAVTQTSGGKMFNIGSFGGAGRNAATSFRPATQVAQVGSVSRGGFGSSATAHRSSAGS